MNVATHRLTPWQQTTLILLRTAIGWHLLYEGYTKVLNPAWSRAGQPLEPFSSAVYLQSARGPLAAVFHSLARPEWLPWIDSAVSIALIVSGALLILGLFTRAGAALALALLAAFYGSAIPLTGLPEPHSEGTYLLVNKNLVELIAVAVLLSFGTGRIAGLDLLFRRPSRDAARIESRV